MKHIKRKFTHQVRLSDDAVNGLSGDLATDYKGSLNSTEIASRYDAWIVTDKNYCAKTFRYPFGGESLFVPEPDPILIYFNVAQVNYRHIATLESRQKLIDLLKELRDATKMIHSLYTFLGHSSAFAVFSFMSVECLVNKVIPDNYFLRKELKLKTEEYNIDQVQQFDIIRKLKDILPEVTGRAFPEDYPQDYRHIIDLKDFRNEVVHTKKQVKDETYYRKLFIKALDYDYSSCIVAVKNLINYYQDNLVEECNCGADF